MAAALLSSKSSGDPSLRLVLRLSLFSFCWTFLLMDLYFIISSGKRGFNVQIHQEFCAVATAIPLNS